MRKLALALAAVAAFAGQAMAADMAARPVKAPPPPAPIASWTGFYIYGGVGYGMWAADTITVVPGTNLCALCAVQTQGGKGWLGTVGAGYDWQFGNFVLGAFADYTRADIKGTIQDQGPFFAANTSLDWSWAAGGRVGWIAIPGLMTYVGGGYTQAHFTGNTAFTTFLGAPQPFRYNGITTDGWFLSSGVEVTFASVPGLFWRNEYRYSRYDAKDFVNCSNAAGVCGVLGLTANNIRFQPDVQTVTTSLVYKFNWGGPVVAKY
jgi:outer membrane immunogenic protein